MGSTSLQPSPENISCLIGLGYDAALTPAAWRAFATAAASAGDADLAMIEYRDEAVPERSFLVAGGIENPFEELMNTARSTRNDDSYLAAVEDQPVGTFRLGSEVVQPEAMYRTDTYSRIAMPWQLEYFLFGTIIAGNGVTAIISLGRRAGAEPFVPGDKKIIGGPLVAHLRRSFSLHRAFEEARATNAILVAAIDNAPYGLVVFDARRKPMIVNRRASAIFGTDDGLTMLGGTVRASDVLAQSQLEWALAAALETASGHFVAPPPPVQVARKLSPHCYRLMYSPISVRSDHTDFPPGSAVVLIIQEERRAAGQSVPAALRATYGLTRAEVRLCEALLQGQTLVEAAETVHTSRNTAKTHLTRIFDKTGVRTQVALLRLLTLGTRA
ncbi:MAG: hypothetical protein ABI567_01900 [Gammaproteobacteria bacterium]